MAPLASGSSRQTGVGHQPGVLMTFVLFCCLAIFGRLAWLQLLHGAEFKAMADENRIRLLPRDPVRGRLLDRQGRVLATNRLTYNLYLQPRLLKKGGWPALRDQLAELLQLRGADLETRRQQGAHSEGFRIRLAGPLTPVQVLRFRERADSLPGAEVAIEVRRTYPNGALASHLMGYTSNITEE